MDSLTKWHNEASMHSLGRGLSFGFRV